MSAETQSLFAEKPGRKRKVINEQCKLILYVLRLYRDTPYNNGWVPLPKILELLIASHTRRISDLREAGYDVRCEDEWVDGQRRTKYKLMSEPSVDL
jgi:hypothetical protein